MYFKSHKVSNKVGTQDKNKVRFRYIWTLTQVLLLNPFYGGILKLLLYNVHSYERGKNSKSDSSFMNFQPGFRNKHCIFSCINLSNYF